MPDMFDLSDKTVVVTGGAGFLGVEYARALIDRGAEVHLIDTSREALDQAVRFLGSDRASGHVVDVTDRQDVEIFFSTIPANVLINNAASDPKVTSTGINLSSRFETMSDDYWHAGTKVALDGTFLCSQAFCNAVTSRAGRGVVINVASDLGIISPDQRLYRRDGLTEEEQSVKPITYSAAKWAIVGMTKYLATYYAKRSIRVNCISPGGVRKDQPDDFVEKLSELIPMGRMAESNEINGIIVYLVSDASSYVTGANFVVDGGRTVW